MKLGDLLNDIIDIEPRLRDLEVRRAQEDSRQVEAGDLFVAVPGLTVDGSSYAEAAVRAGAVAVVAGQRLSLDPSVPCVVVDDPARALALMAARLEGDPGRRLQLVGITGTNGKTTTTYLVEAILAAARQRPGVVGTVSYRYGGRVEPAPFTTPTALVLQRVLRSMADAGCTHVVAEVSSHALQLGRVWGLSFAVGAFTHLTQDHLDLHGTMEAYLAAKQLLFERHVRRGGTAVINLDGAGAQAMVEVVARRGDLRLLGCSTAGHPRAAARLEGLRCSVDGIEAQLVLEGRRAAIRSPLLGAYNADNILLAAACCHALGVDLPAIVEGTARLRGVPGRLERVEPPQGARAESGDSARLRSPRVESGGSARLRSPRVDYAVLVDYSHTPDALERAMGVLRPLCHGRLIVVFGCGGDRDRTKRPLMGRAVAQHADLAVVTSDNPRTEEPLAIIEAILQGMRRESLPEVNDLREVERGYIVQADRRAAIGAAVQAARPGDIVLIAGKGHEDYQILGKTKIHFDDREEAHAAMRELLLEGVGERANGRSSAPGER